MNIQTSRAIYDMPIISPQHAHWRAVRKLFDKKVQVVHHRFQRIFNLNDGTAESGGGREAWKLEPRRATLAANITLSSFLRRNYGSDPRVRQQTSCFPPVLTFYNFQANSAPLAVRLLGNYLKYLNSYLPTTTEDSFCVAETLTPAGAMCYMCG